MYFKKSEGITETNQMPVNGMNPQVNSEVPPVANAGKAKGKKDDGRRVKMLFMTLLIYICITMLPLFTFPKLWNFSIYATDIARVSKVGLELDNFSEGDLVTEIEEHAEEAIENAEDPLEEEFLRVSYGKLAEFAAEIEAKLIDVFAELSVVFTALYAAVIIAIIGLITMIIASLMNKKLLYLIGNAVVLVVLLGLSVAASKFIGTGEDYIGNGTALAFLLLILNFFVPFIKRKNKNA